MKRNKLSESKNYAYLTKGIVYLLLLVMAFFVLVPFVYMVTSAFKTYQQVQAYPIEWIPDPFKWNMPELLKVTKDYGGGLRGMFLRTSYIVGLVIFGQVLSCSVVAFGFARFQTRLTEPLFLLFLATMMIPREVTQIPLYLLFIKLGWMNTYKPLIIPMWFGTPFYVFLLRQFIKTIPKQLDEAAYIDGANSFTIFSRIILPLIKPALFVVVIFVFVMQWNDLYGPLIYLQDASKFTLSLGLAAVNAQPLIQMVPPLNIIMLLSAVAMLPSIIVFFIFQRYFVRGIMMSGFKM